MNPNYRNLALWAIIAVLLIALFNLFQSPQQRGQVREVPYSEFLQEVESGRVNSVTITGERITGTYTDSATGFQTYSPGDSNLVQRLEARNVTINARPDTDGSNSIFGYLISWLPMLLILGVWIFFMRQMQSGSGRAIGFGKSKAKLLTEAHGRVTFADVAGVDEAKQDLEEIVEFLRDPQKFQRLGGKIPRGVLLVGPPGTGKTLLARAVAGEAGVPFFSMSGSEFVEVLVGVGASRVRDLFDQAKKAAPSIIFIDEIDAVGRQRGSSINTNDEREQTLNQLLVEMDGFDTAQAVVIIAATNRPDGLDQALLRPGRFDRRVTVDRPDWNGRLAILKIHTRDLPLSSDVNLAAVARSTPGMVGADLANLANEAALLAARRNLDAVDQRCFDDALDKILLGAERPLVLSDQDLNITAYHEGGHALVALLSPFTDPITKVTIVPRGQALGVTMSTPLDDRYNYSKEYLLGQITMAMGGRAAEEVVFGSITTGAENDLQRVTALARQMVTRWGMSERVGTISFSERASPFSGATEVGQQYDYSETTAEVIDEEVEHIVRSAYARAIELLQINRPTLDRIAQELRRNETIDANQLRAILQETGITPAPDQPPPQGQPLVITPPEPSEQPVPPEVRSTSSEQFG